MESSGKSRKSNGDERGKAKVVLLKGKRGKRKRHHLPPSNSNSASESVSEDGLGNMISMTGLTLESEPDTQEELVIGSLLDSSASEDGADADDDRKARKTGKEVPQAVKGKYDATSYRSNLQTAIKDIKALKFRNTHMKAIKRTPFWFFFNALYSCEDSRFKMRCDKDERAVKQIILSYNDMDGKFQIGGKLVELTKRDVQLVFGVIGGKKSCTSLSTGSGYTRWVVRCFGKEIEKGNGKLVMYKKHILKKISDLINLEDDRELDVARLVHCYLLAAVFAPNKNASMPMHLTFCLEDFGSICGYDWCTYIVDMLKSQISGRTSSRTGGCTILLPYWLCEHVKLITPINKVSFPRFLRWNLKDLNKKLMRASVDEVPSKDVNRHELEATKPEKEIIRTLVSYWAKEVRSTPKEVSSEDDLQETPACTPIKRKGKYRRPAAIARLTDEDDFEETVDIGLECTPARGHSKLNRTMVFDDPSSSRNQSSNRNVEMQEKSSYERVNTSTNVKGTGNYETAIVLSHPTFSLNCPEIVSVGVEENVEDGGVMDAEGDIGIGGGIDAGVQNAVKYGFSGEEMEARTKSLESQVEELKQVIEDKEKTIIDKEQLVRDSLREKDERLVEYEKALRDKERDIEMMRSQLAATAEKDNEIMKLKKEVEKCTKAAKSNLKEKMIAYLDSKWGSENAALKAQNTALRDENVALKADHVGLKEQHASELDRKEEIIVYLRSQIEDLTKPLTITQILENPETLAQIEQIEALTIANNDLIRRNEKLQDELTPVANKRTERDACENSMIKRVKQRTDRKAIEFTPPPSSAEIITVDGLPPRPSRPSRTKRLDEHSEAVQSIDPDVKKRILEYLATEGDEYVVWVGDDELNKVLLCDILLVLNEQRLSSSVIDSWSELLRDLAKDDAKDSRTIVVSGKAWDLIANIVNRSSTLLDLFVDGPLGTVDGEDVVLIPILANNDYTPTPARIGDHWTLLKLDLKKCQWSFLNPRRPRHADPHLKASFVVIDYVESKLRENFRKRFPDHKILKWRLAKPLSVLSTQQVADSLDCGIVVSYHIENEIFKRESKRGDLSKILSGDYRRRMTEWFMDPANIVVE